MPEHSHLPTKAFIAVLMLCLMLLTIAEMSGFFPAAETQPDKKLHSYAENLADQLHPLITTYNQSAQLAVLSNGLSDHPAILSLVIETLEGEMQRAVAPQTDSALQTDLIQLPIGTGSETVGTLSVSYIETNAESAWSAIEIMIVSLWALLASVILYLLFSENHNLGLNSSSVIPERVRAAFNALSEGLLILDHRHRIILANDSFCHKIGESFKNLLDSNADALPWKHRENTDKIEKLPWHISLNNCEQVTGVPIRLALKESSDKAFSVNSAPIFDNNGQIRGVLATFDDMTELEKQYRQLKSALLKLRNSEKALRNKTVELEFLATRDSLTGCLNRRAFFKKFDQLFKEAKTLNRSLVFIMVDIDRFKFINDHYGHANGDKVIKYVSEILSSNSRPEDVVGRYGGDEFAIVLPNATMDEARSIAERLRMDIQQKCHSLFTNPQTVTTSIGMAALEAEVEDSMLLINNADCALYEAKQQGRNCIINWTPQLRHKTAKETTSGSRLLTDSDWKEMTEAERHLHAEILRLEDIVGHLESELEFNRQEMIRRQGKDELTGLPNRYIFNDRISQELARCERNNKLTAIISIDIDSFSRINEALGVTTGDQILKLTAERLIESLRKTDTIAVVDEHIEYDSPNISRINKDEFALILSDLEEVKSVTWVAHRILSHLKKPMYIDDQELFITFSMGVAIYPHDDETPNELLQKAATARRSAKEEPGSNHIRFFSREINRKAFHSIWLETQLTKAIYHQQFELVYQPKFSLYDGKIVGLEALARWPHPKVGYIPPDEFIPIAEHTGLINKLGFWVFKKACADMRRLHKKGFPDLMLGVNLSAVQLRDSTLADKFLSVCSKRKIPPSLIELEITESTLIKNFEHSKDVMQKMHKAGINFALDDFGKGFSSLNYLQKLPINSIKLDREFLNNTLPSNQTQTIVSAIISLAKSLDLKIVAEGVETEAQRQFLDQYDCNEIQGTLFSPPVNADDALDLLRKFNSN
ncbi:MAG: diguanylate cyclase [Candidatus Thiodiazotropha taylori]|nr:diguanylate cyclase [Candidatus Thiodiazotropha endolucinida]MCG8043109.1 diguanylate cyclase [Candidatus Thiodiazotropha taylori]MCG8057169.1 diguanylate cyclase [Candidatus Thiodiazotropha taylori]MCW4228209.1 diguanylate cyclase [Candidatus Thiodiazotropha taylori]MCW4319002.1 diguanylate cyclase [Candidatus Thiodiazotropha taylori]